LRPPNYRGPKFVSDITHPVTFVALLAVLAIGGWIIYSCWFAP